MSTKNMHSRINVSKKKERRKEGNKEIKEFKKKKKKGLLWWYRELESVCQCRGHRFDPWSGRIPQPVKQ